MPATAPRPQRADAARNRELLLAAAEEALMVKGLDASVTDITERAGVAKGTFFRHFATKDDLIAAVVAHHVTTLVEAGERLLEEADAGRALLDFLTIAGEQRQRHDVAFLLRAGQADARVVEVRDLLLDTVRRLVERARDDGVLREDVTPTDVFLLMCAPHHVVSYATDPSPDLWRRYLAIVFDGLRGEGAHPLPTPAPLPPR